MADEIIVPQIQSVADSIGRRFGMPDSNMAGQFEVNAVLYP